MLWISVPCYQDYNQFAKEIKSTKSAEEIKSTKAKAKVIILKYLALLNELDFMKTFGITALSN